MTSSFDNLRRLRPVALALAFGAVACGSSGDEAARDAAGSADPTASQPGPQAHSIAFEEAPLIFASSEVRPVRVYVSPPGVYAVRFSLHGDVQDAYLSESEVFTADDGTASVDLRAPSAPAAFRIRASVGGTLSAETAASASNAFTDLVVQPDYAGARIDDIVEWVATVRTGVTCAELSGVPPPDGILQGTDPATPVITQVPVGTALAVTLRAEYFAGGCADLAASDLAANEQKLVTVRVVDRPLQMDQTDLEVTLGVETSAEWQAAAEPVISAMLSAFTGGALSDATALLDAIEDEDASGSFAVFRGGIAVDATALTSPDLALFENPLRAALSDWLRTGMERLVTDSAFAGDLAAVPDTPGFATFALQSVAGEASASAGFPDAVTVTWSAEPGDKVRLGAQLFWVATMLMSELANAAASEAAGVNTTVPDALAESLSCDDLGAVLLGAETYGDSACDAACLSALCRSALVTMWQRARAALNSVARLDVTAAGDAEIDAQARPVAFTGRWVGTVQLLPESLPLRLEGAAHGETPEPIGIE